MPVITHLDLIVRQPVFIFSLLLWQQINGNSVDSTGSDDVMAMLTSLRGLPITLMIARPTPTPTKPTQRRRAILKLQTRVS